MDPDATWQSLRAALQANDRERATELASDLLIWLDGGGFLPQCAESHFVNAEAWEFAIRRTCRTAIEATRKGARR